jgi:opacity protein-like surface antigen
MRKIKIILTLIILAFFCSSIFAQKGTGFIGISGGVSIPSGNWARANYVVNTQAYQNDPSGFASVGGIVALDGAYFFSKHIGIGAMINYATYKTRDLDTLSGGYRESFDVDQVTTTANSYKIWNFLPGLYFKFPAGKKLSVTAKALAGITHATTPQYSVDVEDGGVDDGTFYQKSATKTSFAFAAGAGLSYPVTKCFAINLLGDYFYSRPDFTIENSARENAAGRLVTNYNQPLSGINISLGVAFLFGKK